jgi:molecular chaperone GrpE (heat shock protein)
MRNPKESTLAKWPFFLGDALLLGAACFIYSDSKLPMGPWQIAFLVLCVAGGASLAIMPFLLEYRLLVKLAEARELATVVSQVQNLERLAAHIGGATGQWQSVQEQADKTVTTARNIAERMAAELKGFNEFMQRANDAEKRNLHLEVDKLRRAETEWLQVLVRVLDHVHALHQGAVRSGQPNVIAQVGNFQTACRDAARRVGLAPFIAGDSEPFDAQRHQLVESNGATDGAVIGETVAAGYTFQGKLLRPALVRLRQKPGPAVPNGATTPDAAPRQNQLPLQPAGALQG